VAWDDPKRRMPATGAVPQQPAFVELVTPQVQSFPECMLEVELNRTAKSDVGNKSLNAECMRPGTPLSLEDARRLVEGDVEHYNNVRLNSAIGYVTPKDMRRASAGDLR
jgi:hypothetical protein